MIWNVLANLRTPGLPKQDRHRVRNSGSPVTCAGRHSVGMRTWCAPVLARRRPVPDRGAPRRPFRARSAHLGATTRRSRGQFGTVVTANDGERAELVSRHPTRGLFLERRDRRGHPCRRRGHVRGRDRVELDALTRPAPATHESRRRPRHKAGPSRHSRLRAAPLAQRPNGLSKSGFGTETPTRSSSLVPRSRPDRNCSAS